MGAGQTLTPAESSWCTMSVAPIPSSSSKVTEWQESPAAFLDRGGRLSTTALAGLPASAREKLERLAAGRSEPPEAVVALIAEYFVEAEDERAEGTLYDAVCWYLDNELL